MINQTKSTFPSEVAVELVRARTKFQFNRMVILAMIEEFGELAEQLKRGPILGDDRESKPDEIRLEGVQSAVMIQRVVEEGDPALDYNDPASLWTDDALCVLECLGNLCKAILQRRRSDAIDYASALCRIADKFHVNLQDLDKPTQ